MGFSRLTYVNIMNLYKLIIKEIFYRKVNFILSCFAATAAIIVVISAFSLLEIHDAKTQLLLNQKVAETEKRVQELEDDIRKITKKMGFNVLILPKDQNLDDFYSNNYASKFMPEEYVNKLAKSRIVTVRHLLPTLEQKVEWPEEKRTVILVGIRGEVPIIHKNPLKPIVSAVKTGSVVLGHNLQEKLQLSKGDKIKFKGQVLTVAEIHPERGNKDDITMWMELAQAQQILDKNGKINGIMALECKCAWADLEKIRTEISKILPETKVIGFAGKAQTRKDTRNRIEKEALSAIETIKKTRSDVRNIMEKSSAVIVPLVIIIGAIWISILAFTNTRERKYEIGLLRALGVKSHTVFLIFIGRAKILTAVSIIAGLLVGFAIPYVIATHIDSATSETGIIKAILNIKVIVGTVLFAPLLIIISTWLPAMMAAKQDPADILREE